MSERTEHEDPQAEPEFDPEVLAAWRVPEPAPDLLERVMNRMDTVVTMMPDASMTTPAAGSPPSRGRLGLWMVGGATLAAAALVLGLGRWWSAPPPAEVPSPAAVTQPASAAEATVPPAAATVPPVAASLVVRTLPRDASVWVDGKPVAGPSPFVVSQLPAGPHRIKVERDGYLPTERTLEGGAAVELPVELALREVVLVLSVDPPGATVKLLGTGDAIDIGSDGDRHVLRREPGVHYEVEASAPGYLTRRVPLSLGADADVPVALTLVPDPDAPPPKTVRSPDLEDPFKSKSSSSGSGKTKSSKGGSPNLKDPFARRSGTLRIAGSPDKGVGRVSLDGKFIGQTPLFAVKVTAGKHRVVVHWSDGTKSTKTVVAKADEALLVKWN